MDCASFRDSKLATPNQATSALLAHTNECTACAAFAREVDVMERDLQQALLIDVPDDMAQHIIAHPIAHPRRKLAEAGWLQRLRETLDGAWLGPALGAAMAVCVLALGGLLSVNSLSTRNEMADAFIAHVVAEPAVLQANDVVDPQQLPITLARFGGSLQQPVGRVRHFATCLIDGQPAHHILVETPHGIATLIVLPGKATRGSGEKAGFSALVLPLKSGSLGVVTPANNDGKQVRQFVRKRMRVES